MSIDSLLAKAVKQIHSRYVFKRRVRVLARHLADLLPANPLKGLDVGCGNGEIAATVISYRNDVSIEGADILVRPQNFLAKVTQFDGERLPFPDKSYDFVMLVDVLHHTTNPLKLLKECVRVSRQFIFIKDHYCQGRWDRLRLRFMDWVGNRAYNVVMPYNYFSREQWRNIFQELGFSLEISRDSLHCYPWPFTYVFDDKLHFISKFKIH